MSVVLHRSDGVAERLPVARWHAPATDDERRLLATLAGPALDIGCGPGRLVRALVELGVPALGLDASARAIAAARASGAPALHGSVFETVPAEGQWPTALLMDGNIGIGGDPVRLLTRVRQIVTSDATVLVEVDPHAPRRVTVDARLEHGGRRGPSFTWTIVPMAAISAIGTAASMPLDHWVSVDDRPIAVLRPQR